MLSTRRYIVLGLLSGFWASGSAYSAEPARIEGIHYQDGKPAPGEIALEYVERGSGKEMKRVHADTEGRFVFEEVEPGEVRVGRFVEYVRIQGGASWPAWTSSHTRILFPKPGETLEVELGNGGWTVRGRMVAPENARIDVGWQAGSGRRLYSTERDEAAPPAGLTREEVAAWRKERYDSEEARAIRGRQRMYVVDVEEDGRFEVADVLPGSYHLYIEVDDAAKDQDKTGPMGAGMASLAVTVPEGEGGEVDLGAITVKLYDHLQPGDAAPAFTAKTLDGKSITLSDFQGKYVLIDFWATWCGPCIAEMPKMKALYERFGQHPAFVMLGLSVDNERDRLANYVKDEGLKWVQGYLGPWSETDVLDNYGVRGIPSVFLVGPDGKVVAKNLRGDRVAEVVAKALGE